jgi:hypothetical protein
VRVKEFGRVFSIPGRVRYVLGVPALATAGSGDRLSGHRSIHGYGLVPVTTTKEGETHMKKALLASLVTVLITACAMADTKPINLSLTPEVAVYDSSTFIKGLTLSIWGENEQSSLAFGIVNGTTGDSSGLSLGFLLNYADNYKGAQWAPVNYTKGNFLGWQAGCFNYVGGKAKGLQTGFLNIAEKADSCVQIGLVNLIHSNGEWFSELPEELAPGMIFVNWGF